MFLVCGSCLFSRSFRIWTVLDDEGPDTLGFQSHASDRVLVLWWLRNWFCIHYFIIFSLPTELLCPLHQVWLRLASVHAGLCNRSLRNCTFRVGFAVKPLSILLNIKILYYRRAIEVVDIKSIGHILKTNKDFILIYWKRLILYII